MTDYRYLIVGGGMTADSAVKGIRELDKTGTIGVIGAEADAPYERPPLSKGLWKDQRVDGIWRKASPRSAVLHLGRTVELLDLKERTATDSRGTSYRFEKLLLATGGTPRKLPFAGAPVIYFRTLADYRSLRELCETGEHFAVIGGGFIGSEVAAALSMNGKKVTMIFPDETLGGRVYPPDLGRFVTDYYRQKGVDILSGDTVTALATVDGRKRIRTKGGRSLEVDGIVAGLGLLPNTALAQTAGLEVDNGIVVDGLLRTSAPDVFAAGDVASFHNPALDRRIRVEHEDNANAMGRQAGRNMAGAGERYTHLPFFYSDLFDLGYEAVGELDARLDVVEDWKEPFREGVVYFLREGRVRGVLLWNVWGQVDRARDLIASMETVHPESLRGRLGNQAPSPAVTG